MKRYINPKNTAHPLLSQAVVHNSNYTMELSGQIGVDSESGKMVESMNEVYSKYFSENLPARIALAVKELPLNALIEVESIAVGENVK